MIIQRCRSRFAVLPGRCHALGYSGGVTTRSSTIGCIQFWSDGDLSLSVEFLEGIRMYTWVDLRCVLWGIRIAKHFCGHDGSTHRKTPFLLRAILWWTVQGRTYRRSVMSSARSLTKIQREKADAAATRRECSTVASLDVNTRCGAHRSRRLWTRTNTPCWRFRWPPKYRKNDHRLLGW